MSIYGKNAWNSLTDEVNAFLDAGKPPNIKFISRMYGNGFVEMEFINDEDAVALRKVKCVFMAESSVPTKFKAGSVMKLAGHDNLIIVDANTLDAYIIMRHSKHGIAALVRMRCPKCANGVTFAENMILCERCEEMMGNCEKIGEDMKEIQYLHLTFANGIVINGNFG